MIMTGVDPLMPAVRDQCGCIYIREWSGGILAGGFEPRGKPCFQDGVPKSFEFQLLSEDWDHFGNFNVLFLNLSTPVVSKSDLVSLYKLMGFYMEDLILGVILQYMVYASFSCFSQVVKLTMDTCCYCRVPDGGDSSPAASHGGC